MIRQAVEDGGVDLQHLIGAVGPGILQAVVDNRGDIGLIPAVGLLFNEGGNGDDLGQIIRGILQLFQDIPVDLPVEVIQQPFQGALGIMAHIEFIGVREEVTLQAADVLRLVVNKLTVELRRLGGFQQFFLGVDTLFRQKPDNLADRVALRDRHCHRIGAGVLRTAPHPHQKGVVVHVGVQFKGSRADFLIRVGDFGKEFEKPLVLDEAGVAEFVRHSVQIVRLRYGDGNIQHLLPVEGAHVRGQHPPHACQGGGGRHYKQHIDQQHQDRVPPFSPAALFRGGGTGALLLVFPHLLGVPVGCISILKFCHENLHTFCPGRRGMRFPGRLFFQWPGSTGSTGA